MSNIIDKIQVSGVTYDLPSGGSGSTTVELTQAEYDALVSGGTVDPNTYYIISDASPADMSNYWTSAQTNSAITAAISGKADTSAVTASIEAATSGKVDTSSVVSSVTSASTNNEIPTAKAVYDATQSGGGGGTTYSAGRGISIANDTISVSLPISASTISTDSIVGGYFGNTSMAQYGFAYGDNAKCGNGGSASIALGRNVTANGSSALALGSDCTAKGQSVAIGRYINTNILGEIGVGIYNTSSSGSSTFGDSGNTLFSVGNGTSNNARHNAFEIRQNGDIYITSGGTDIKLQDNLGGGGGGSITIDPTLDSGSTNPVANSAITAAISGKVDTSSVVSSVTSTSTNSEIPTAKAVYDAISQGGGGGGGMSEDTERLIATSLVDLNDRKIDASEVKANYQRKGDYATKSELAQKANASDVMTLEKSKENELVTAAALNNLNEKFGGLKLVKITQSEYTALANKDENTLYVVIADPS